MQNVSSRVPVRVGDRFTNRFGCEALVLSYTSAKKVTVRFMDDFGYELTTNADALRKGRFRNLYQPTIYGMGYAGEGPHAYRQNDRHTVAFTKWYAMLQRCYGDLKRYEVYKGCTVCPEWLNFQNFAEWLYRQPLIDGMEIDKDILVKSNRVYAPQNCSMVPAEINVAMTGRKRNRNSELPTGVRVSRGRFIAQITTSSKARYLGTFDTPEEAFSVYKQAKELHIKSLAEKYKSVISADVYQSMMNWEVLITD